jgi:hypothetical protein
MVAVADTIRDPQLRASMEAQMGLIVSARAGRNGPDAYRHLNPQFFPKVDREAGVDLETVKRDEPKRKPAKEADAVVGASVVSGTLLEMGNQVHLGPTPQAQKPPAPAMAGANRLRSFGADLNVAPQLQPGVGVPQQVAQLDNQPKATVADTALLGMGLEKPAPGPGLQHRHLHLHMTVAPRPVGMV